MKLSKLSKVSVFICLLVIFGLFSTPAALAMSTFIPGAHSVVVKESDDLTTNNPKNAGLSEPNRVLLAPSDYSGDGKPKPIEAYLPKIAVPGLEITGMFDDAKFLIRIPRNWNGKLVIMGAPGLRDEYSGDALIGDYVLTKIDEHGGSYAYASTDKGVCGDVIPGPDGKIQPWSKALTAFLNPADGFQEWGPRIKQLTVATKDVLKQLRGTAPTRTYLVGMSNGGYTGRYAMEQYPELFDGLVDWEGAIWQANGHNMVSTWAVAVNAWAVINNPQAIGEDKEKAYAALAKLGVVPESYFLLRYYANNYYLVGLNQFRMSIDPEFKSRNWGEYFSNPTDYKDYDYFKRPAIVRERVAKFENTGKITKPTITVFGDWDNLLFYGVHAKGYETLVQKNGKPEQYRLYTISHGTHIDALAGSPVYDKEKQIQPLLPYVHQAFDTLVEWVENGTPAPASKVIPAPQIFGNTIDIKTGAEIAPY